MSVEIKNFLIITIAFIFNVFLVNYQGVSLIDIARTTRGSVQVWLYVPVLILSYHILFFIFTTIKGVYIKKTKYFKMWQYDVTNFFSDMKKVFSFTLLFIYLIIFQTSFKSIYAWQLATPNNVDWLLYTFDRMFLGPSLWWWGSQLLSHNIWLNVVYYLDRFYMPYFAYQWFVIMYIVFHETSDKREYFITTFFLIWMFGTTIGGLCQSGGPFFFSYAPWHILQMKGLEAINHIVPLYSLNTQNYLWQSYFDVNKTMLAGGISAFPSLHIAICLFIYLFFRECGYKYLTILTFIGLMITWIGSMILGWHYFVDGLGAVCIVYLAQKTAIALHKS
ncbi:MAG: phosphatase PAP2 family protein [Pseudomonadota bacterium]|nr:phosphatase PAP2 family protein [Pseudomonadota bacterium]